jgi:hypothetical protein
MAQVKLVNKLIFDTIQEVQEKDRARSNEQIFEYGLNLDKELDVYMELAFKIKDRDLKKEIMQEIYDCKERTRKIMEVLRSTQGTISNA